MDVDVELTAQQEQLLRAAGERRWPGEPLEVVLARAFLEHCREARPDAEEAGR
jgi:hypothetical protein